MKDKKLYIERRERILGVSVSFPLFTCTILYGIGPLAIVIEWGSLCAVCATGRCVCVCVTEN